MIPELRPCRINYYKDGNLTQAIGLFHTWGFAAKQDPDMGNVQYSVAVVELKDGKVVPVDPMDLQFLDREVKKDGKKSGNPDSDPNG